MPALAVALGVGSIGAVTTLDGRADAARAAQVRLATTRAQLNALQGMPWLSRTAGTSVSVERAPMVLHERLIVSTLAALQRERPSRTLAEAGAHLIENFAALERVRELNARNPRLAERLMGLAGHEEAIATRALLATGAAYERRAKRDDREAMLGTAIVILLLVSAFACFYLRSVSARRRHERTARDLRDSESKYREMVEGATELIATVDLEDRFVSVNAAFGRTLGYSPEELVGRSVSDFTPPESRAVPARATKEKLSGHSETTTIEHELIAKDGRRVPVEVVSRLIFEDGRPVAVQAVCRDISKRKATERELRKLEQRLQATEKLEVVGRLAGGIAHDFNNLLTAICGYSDIALAMAHPGDGSLRECVQEIRRAGDSAAELTGQLLAFSRNQVLQPRVLDLNEIVREMQPMLTRLLGEDVTVRLALASDLGAALCDPGQFGQVVLNLAVNARDAMPDGGTLTIATRNVVVDAEEPVGLERGSHVALSVTDTGVGMSSETRERIFEPFYTTKQDGTGLGLATVFGIVKQSGGEVTVYSEAGFGTTFNVYLPRSDAKPTTAGQDETSNVEELRPAPGVRVLLAEDNKQVRELVKRVLVSLGYEVLEAATPREAIELSATTDGEIELLLTDVVMPGMNGRELFERLCEERPALRVLFVSGFTDDAILARGILASDVAFLQKPFSHDELARKLKSVLMSQPAAA